jgi:hypothetical protein
VDLQAQLEFEAATCMYATVPKFFPQFFQAYGKRVWDELWPPAIMVFPTLRSFNHGAYMQSAESLSPSVADPDHGAEYRAKVAAEEKPKRYSKDELLFIARDEVEFSASFGHRLIAWIEAKL